MFPEVWPSCRPRIGVDRYHISAHLNSAVDAVRKGEYKALLAAGDSTLAGSKYQWLRTYEDWRSSPAVSFRALHQLDLKTSRAWHLKEDAQPLGVAQESGPHDRCALA